MLARPGLPGVVREDLVGRERMGMLATGFYPFRFSSRLLRFRRFAMSRPFWTLGGVGILSIILASAACADEELVDNPFYKFWASSKPGAKAVHHEQTKLSGPESTAVPGGVDEKRIAYKLLEVGDKRVVVEMVVRERDLLGFIQAAPTRYIYPVKLKKSQLERVFQEANTKSGEETIKVGDKELNCKTVVGSVKGQDGERFEYKLWLSDEVPGTIVKQVRTDRQKGDVVAVTTTTLQSYKKAD
jgi:hypothetical protein